MCPRSWVGHIREFGLELTTLFWVAGLVGVAFYLGSYAALQAGVLRGSGYAYAILNLIAASLVLVSLFTEWSLSSAIIQVSWIVISVVGLTRIWLENRALSFSAEEQALLSQRFATLRKSDARRLLDHGRWVDGLKGDVLTQQGRPVQNLDYLSEGAVDVIVDGQTISRSSQGKFIGELGCLSKGPASATVVLNGPGRIFRTRSDDLIRLLQRRPDLRPHVEYAFASCTQEKLRETNALLGESLRAQRAK